MTRKSQERVAKNLLWCVRRACQMGGAIIYVHKFFPDLPASEQSEEEKIIIKNNLSIVLLTPEILEDPHVKSAFSAFHEAIRRRKAELGI